MYLMMMITNYFYATSVPMSLLNGQMFPKLLNTDTQAQTRSIAMAGQQHGLTNKKESKTNTSKSISPTIEDLKKDLFIAIEMLNGYTESEALLNWKCTQGLCQCP